MPDTSNPRPEASPGDNSENRPYEAPAVEDLEMPEGTAVTAAGAGHTNLAGPRDL